MKKITYIALALAGLIGTTQAAESKRLLIVTVSTGFRHSSIELTEQVLRQLATKSGDITVVSTSESPNYPRSGLPAGWTPGLSRDQQSAVLAMNATLNPLNQQVAAARTALTASVFAEKADAADIRAKITAIAASDLAVANGRAGALEKLQASANRLNAAQIAAIRQPAPAGNPNGSMDLVMQEYFAPDKLKNYDGMWFISTVGELPFPDRDAFFKWVADGHSVMGNHGASDSMHQTPEWAKMLGGEFQRHGQQSTGAIRNFDTSHPATAKWGEVIAIHEELYMFRPNYDRNLVHSLLTMTEGPADGRADPGAAGWFPVSWAKMYGNGKVFFTSLGHREDVVDPTWTDGSGNRQNSPEVALAVQEHYLGGMRWALGLAAGDAKPQTAKQ